jgi:hypothetical protein
MNKMKRVLAALAGCWRKSRVSIIIVVLLAFGVIVAGLHDVGIVMGILAAVVILVEMTRRWRRTRNFIIMFFTSLLGMAFLSFLDIEVVKPLVYFIGGEGAASRTVFDVFNQVISLIILFFGLAGVLTGFFGTIITGAVSLVALVKRRKNEAKI